MINIYTISICSHCKQIKEYCKENNIQYNEINIEEEFKARSKLLAKGYMTVPVVEINDQFKIGDFDIVKEFIIENIGNIND